MKKMLLAVTLYVTGAVSNPHGHPQIFSIKKAIFYIDKHRIIAYTLFQLYH